MKIKIAATIITVSLASGSLIAQNYPSKPVRILAGGAGGGGDFAARLIAQGLSSTLGQQVVIDNRGGSVAVPAGQVAKAPADGHMLLFFSAFVWLYPLLADNVPYDPVRDLAPITLAIMSPQMLVVHPSLQVNSVKELIALARAKPGALNYASAGNGTGSHLAAELFAAMASVKIVRIGYRSTGESVINLLTGQTQLMVATAPSVAPHVRSSRLRALAVTSAQPSALLPGLPTIASTGVPGYESITQWGMFAPAKTPDAIVRLLNQETVRVLNRTDMKEKLLGAGVETVASSPEELTAMIKAEMTRMGKVIRDAGIREQL